MPSGTFIGWIQQPHCWCCPFCLSKGSALCAAKAAAAAESTVVDGCTLRLGSRNRVHCDCLSVHLPFDDHILSCQLIELALVAFQGVHVASPGKGKVGPFLDAFA